MNVLEDIYKKIFCQDLRGPETEAICTKNPELRAIIDNSFELSRKLYFDYYNMFNNDKSMLLYTVAYNAVFVGLSLANYVGSKNYDETVDLYDYIKQKYDLGSLYLYASECVWPGERYYHEMDVFLMKTDHMVVGYLSEYRREVAADTVVPSNSSIELVQAMMIYGCRWYISRKKEMENTD